MPWNRLINWCGYTQVQVLRLQADVHLCSTGHAPVRIGTICLHGHRPGLAAIGRAEKGKA